MRTASGSVLLLAFFSALSAARCESPAEPAAAARDRAEVLDLGVAWERAAAAPPAGNVWREAYRVANFGDVPSGELRLRLRTPLGLAGEELLAAGLGPGSMLRRTIEVALQPGLSELCIDVRAVDGGRALVEADLSNNRACRRIPRRAGGAESSHANRFPEDVP